MITPTVTAVNLGKKRQERLAAGARNGARGPWVLLLDDDTTIDMPAELPLDVFAPLLDIDLDLGLLLRVVVDAVEQSADDPAAQRAAINTVIDLLAATPRLVQATVGAVRQCGVNLFGEAGFAALVEWRPTKDDLVELFRAITDHYGVSLGESPGSSDSAKNGGPTSSATSNTTTPASMPAGSGGDPANPASWGSHTS